MKKKIYQSPAAETFSLRAGNVMLTVSEGTGTEANLSQEKEQPNPSDDWDTSNWDNLSGLK